MNVFADKKQAARGREHQVVFAGLSSRAAQSGPALVLAEAGAVVPPQQTYRKLRSLLKQALKNSYSGFVLL